MSREGLWGSAIARISLLARVLFYLALKRESTGEDVAATGGVASEVAWLVPCDSCRALATRARVVLATIDL
jgi:hypothetical protein